MIELVKVNMEKKSAEFLGNQVEILLSELKTKEQNLLPNSYLKQDYKRKRTYYNNILESLKQKEYIGFGGY